MGRLGLRKRIGLCGRKETEKRKMGKAKADAGGPTGHPWFYTLTHPLHRWMALHFWLLSSDTGWHLDPHAPTSL